MTATNPFTFALLGLLIAIACPVALGFSTTSSRISNHLHHGDFVALTYEKSLLLRMKQEEEEDSNTYGYEEVKDEELLMDDFISRSEEILQKTLEFLNKEAENDDHPWQSTTDQIIDKSRDMMKSVRFQPFTLRHLVMIRKMARKIRPSQGKVLTSISKDQSIDDFREWLESVMGTFSESAFTENNTDRSKVVQENNRDHKLEKSKEIYDSNLRGNVMGGDKNNLSIVVNDSALQSSRDFINEAMKRNGNRSRAGPGDFKPVYRGTYGSPLHVGNSRSCDQSTVINDSVLQSSRDFIKEAMRRNGNRSRAGPGDFKPASRGICRKVISAGSIRSYGELSLANDSALQSSRDFINEAMKRNGNRSREGPGDFKPIYRGTYGSPLHVRNSGSYESVSFDDKTMQSSRDFIKEAMRRNGNRSRAGPGDFKPASRGVCSSNEIVVVDDNILQSSRDFINEAMKRNGNRSGVAPGDFKPVARGVCGSKFSIASKTRNELVGRNNRSMQNRSKAVSCDGDGNSGSIISFYPTIVLRNDNTDRSRKVEMIVRIRDFITGVLKSCRNQS